MKQNKIPTQKRENTDMGFTKNVISELTEYHKKELKTAILDFGYGSKKHKEQSKILVALCNLGCLMKGKTF